VQNLYLPPANRCFLPTRVSRTNPSGANPARQNGRIRQARHRISSDPKRRRPVHNVGKKRPFRSSPRKAVPFTVVNVFSNDGPWARRPDLFCSRQAAAVQGKPIAAVLAAARGKEERESSRGPSADSRGDEIFARRSTLLEFCFLPSYQQFPAILAVQ